ncbi:hypothetical protein MRB53_031429 [Persea americana]|uniref:Uncharacterized protein n=1 Tax=Persea americana TaxID=3435 RepID=A0ACC2KPE8_PERAE|nr:hypothetical protein MRB53_031429 [Persea americana]
MGMVVVWGSKLRAAIGELGLQHPLGTESLDDSEDPHRGRKQPSNQTSFSLFFRRRRNEKGKSPVKAEASRMTGGDRGDRLYLLKKKQEKEQRFASGFHTSMASLHPRFSSMKMNSDRLKGKSPFGMLYLNDADRWI